MAANNLAWIYQEENDRLDDALRLAQSAAARLPNSGEVHDTIGMIYVKKALPSLAIEAFETSHREAARQPALPLPSRAGPAGIRATGGGRAKPAEQAIKLRPGYAEAQKLLAETKG